MVGTTHWIGAHPISQTAYLESFLNNCFGERTFGAFQMPFSDRKWHLPSLVPGGGGERMRVLCCEGGLRRSKRVKDSDEF